jgi:hypothetical protein
MLREEFYEGDLFTPDPNTTAYNLGRRDVVVYIDQLMNFKDEKDA